MQNEHNANGTSIESAPLTESSDRILQSSGPSPHGNAPAPATFAEICDLIAEGKPIPGIKDIPDTVLEGQGTESQSHRRKKPWENGSTTVEPLSWAK